MSLTDKQREYLQHCSRRWCIKIGAVRSGKTFLDYAAVVPKRVIACRGEGQILLMGVTQQTVNRNLLEPMRDTWGIDLVSQIRHDNSISIFGRKAYVLGADKKTAVDKIRGMTLEYAYVDEAVGINKEVFDMLKSRLSTAHAHCDCTANPADPGHWFKKFLDTPDLDAYIQHYTIEDNPHLTKEYVENLKKEYAGTVFYNRYILGQWTHAEGIIYKAYADDLASGGSRFQRETIPDGLYPAKITIGVDFGGNGSKHAFVAVMQTTDRHVIPVMSQRVEPYGTDADFLGKAFYEFALSVFSRYHMIDAVYVDSAEQVLRQSIKSYLSRTSLAWLSDLIFNSKKIEIIDRIRLTTVLQNSGRFFILPEAKTLSDALSTALYSEKHAGKDERLDDGTTDIDSLDAYEYAIERDYKTLIE